MIAKAQTDGKADISFSLRVLLTTNHYPKTTVSGGLK